MKPGYYMSETGNFHIWYPRDAFVKGEQRMDVVGIDRYGRLFSREESYSHDRVDYLTAVLEFEYIGEL